MKPELKNTNTVKKQVFLDWFKYKWSNDPLFSILIALIIMIILQTMVLGFDYSSVGEWFQSWINNWINILRNNAGIGIVALGMTFVIMTGGIDLAVGSTLVITGAFTMYLLDTGAKGILGMVGLTGVSAIVVTIILVLAFGYLLGALIGLSITKGRVPPFIATLGAMMIFRSVTQHFTQGYNTTVPMEFLQISSFKIGNYMIMPIIYWAVIAYILYYVSKRTTFGRQIIAVGSNERRQLFLGSMSIR